MTVLRVAGLFAVSLALVVISGTTQGSLAYLALAGSIATGLTAAFLAYRALLKVAATPSLEPTHTVACNRGGHEHS